MRFIQIPQIRGSCFCSRSGLMTVPANHSSKGGTETVNVTLCRVPLKGLFQLVQHLSPPSLQVTGFLQDLLGDLIASTAPGCMCVCGQLGTVFSFVFRRFVALLWKGFQHTGVAAAPSQVLLYGPHTLPGKCNPEKCSLDSHHYRGCIISFCPYEGKHEVFFPSFPQLPRILIISNGTNIVIQTSTSMTNQDAAELFILLIS